jgi:hypothetical protein
MKKLRDLIALLAVAAAFTFSLAQFRRVFGLASPWFGLMAMFCLLGLAAFARPLFFLKLPGFLRKEHEWEADGRLYKTLRVRVFGELLRRTPLRYLNPLVYLKRHPDPSIVQAQIESAEAAHLLSAALGLPYMAYACIQGWWSALAWLVVVQAGLNLYPILHLRWARARINRLRDRIPSSRKDAA